MEMKQQQKLETLIERVSESCDEVDGQEVKVEFVFYPDGRTTPISHRWDFHGVGYYLMPGDPAPSRVVPHCRLTAVVEGLAQTEDGVEGEKFGLVDVYFSGNDKAVERLKELTALAGRFIPADWLPDFDQLVAKGEMALARARCLAFLARLWFVHSSEPRTVTEVKEWEPQLPSFSDYVPSLYDANSALPDQRTIPLGLYGNVELADPPSAREAATYHVGEIPKAYSQLERLLRVLAHPDEAPKGRTRVTKALGLSCDEYNTLAMQIATTDRAFAEKPNVREWSSRLKCSTGMVGQLPFYLSCAARAGTLRKGQPPKPKVFSLNDGDQRGRDEELERLIGEQDCDAEPSALEDDAPGSPRIVRIKKKL